MSLVPFRINGEFTISKEGLKDSPQAGPGLKYDNGKAAFALLPPFALLEVAKVLAHGASKYGPRNWSLVKDHVDRYLSACGRHINSYQSGQVIDSETGLNHLAHAVCSLLFILDHDCRPQIKAGDILNGL